VVVVGDEVPVFCMPSQVKACHHGTFQGKLVHLLHTLQFVTFSIVCLPSI